MTEQEWPASINPKKMLSYLATVGEPCLRKHRLFACCCVRRIWDYLADQRSRDAIEAGERFAEGGATEEELRKACSNAFDAKREAGNAMGDGMTSTTPATGSPPVWHLPEELLVAAHAAGAAFLAVSVRSGPEGTPHDTNTTAIWACHTLLWANAADRLDLAADRRVNLPDDEGAVMPEAPERGAQAALLRDLFGNPFRPVVLDTAWRSPVVKSLAQASYNDRTIPAGTLDNDRLAILADALEDAGCTEAAILDHLRGPGPHVRGCFALDLILGKS